MTLIAPVPFVPAEVEHIRRECDWSSRLGVPAHFTLAAGAAFAEVRDVAAALRREAPLALVLAGPEQLRDAACLVPVDPRPLRELCARVADGLSVPPIRMPHVTVARGLTIAQTGSLRRQLAPVLPVTGVLESALLLDYDEGAGAVRTLGSFQLG